MANERFNLSSVGYSGRTGKTTVINSAATLLANSYGFNVIPRFIAKKSSARASPHEYMIFPTGMSYAVDYSDKNQEPVRREWEDWRFSEWKMASRKSGAYLYDFRFLQRKSDKGYSKHPMTPEAFADLLLATPARNEDGTLASTITAQPIKYDTLKALFSEHGASVPSEVDNIDGNASILTKPLYSDAEATKATDSVHSFWNTFTMPDLEHAWMEAMLNLI